MLCQLPTVDDPHFLSADIPCSDAGVYRLRDDLALVQSIDFFTPVVDDPYLFGQIAAANALSDVYAMGGTPVTALNLVGFPLACLGVEALQQVLCGGADKVHEAGAVIVGGHSVEDAEPKYGLAVTGTVDPVKMLSTRGAKIGDRLVLTKPLGTGILTTALKGDVLTAEEMTDALDGMAQLNRDAAEAMLSVGINACTDVTGFGLLGHSLELANASQVCLQIESIALPVYPRTEEMIAMGLIPAGGHRNRDYYLPQAKVAAGVPAELVDLICDPQTSGGLLMAVSDHAHKPLLDALKDRKIAAWTIGKVVEGTATVDVV